MKRMFRMTILVTSFAISAGVVLAQSAPVPVAPASMPVAPASIVASTNAASTNAVSGKPDLAKMQAIFSELGSLNQELRAEEEKLQASDPDVKALIEKKTAAQQAVRDLETQRRELVDKKLSADPKLALQVARRHELQQTLRALRPASTSPGAAGEGRMGMGSRRMPPMEGAAPMQMQPDVAPKAALAPVVAPVEDKPANPAK